MASNTSKLREGSIPGENLYFDVNDAGQITTTGAGPDRFWPRWDVVPLFAYNQEYLDVGFRHVLTGLFIRANPERPNGSAVSLVTEDKVDAWAGWYIGGAVYAGQHTERKLVPSLWDPRTSLRSIWISRSRVAVRGS